MDSIFALSYQRCVPQEIETKMGEVLSVIFPHHADTVKAMLTEVVEFETGYIQISHHHAARLKSVFDEFEVYSEFTDVTQSILMGEEWEKIKEHFEPHEYAWVEQFVRTHLTLDLVLDKILARGIQHLNHWDWQVLDSEGQK